MKIVESQGIITEDGKQWYDLCNVIVDYIYDVQDGLNANPFNEDCKSIYLSNIISYYKYKNGVIPTKLIPFWIGDFEISIDHTLTSKGRFDKQKAILKDDKLYFIIYVNDFDGKDADEFFNTFSHEFRHAYGAWIEKMKNISFHSNRDLILYNVSRKGFKGDMYDQTYNMVSDYGSDYLVMDLQIYEDHKKIELTILRSFYYIDQSEINSFLLEYADQMKKFINVDYKETVVKDLKKVKRLKIDFNALTLPERYESNVLNSMQITQYGSRFYRTYMAYLNFWLGIKLVDETIAQEVVDNIKKDIKTFLHLDLTVRLIQYDGDGLDVLSKIANKEIPILKKVIKKMDRIYARLIMNAQEDMNNEI